jgi:uracil-DNA glycosylase family protein
MVGHWALTMSRAFAAKIPNTSEEWEAIREEARHCRACDLWQPATQTVFGEGPAQAPLMLVGEQPGDKEDIAGRPFVGPAGGILNRALVEAGIAREKTYVTNAVKHFKFVRRGKLRLHQKPDIAEIKACHPWLARERDMVRPALIVALGATAARSVFAKPMPIGRNRGRILDFDAGAKAMITVHPSYLLRVEDAEREREFDLFVADLRLAAAFAR